MKLRFHQIVTVSKEYHAPMFRHDEGSWVERRVEGPRVLQYYDDGVWEDVPLEIEEVRR